MNNSTIFKRIGAYLIDIFLITLIGMAITKISFINPKYEEYKETSNIYNEKLMDYYDHKVEVNEFNKIIQDISYDLNKNGAVYLISDMIVIILYFGIFSYFTKGETLGKKIMGIKIISNKDKPLKIYNYLIRSIFLYGIIMDIITLIAINFNKETYLNIYSIGSNINMFIQIIIFISIMFTASGRGLHDIIAGTKVINAKEIKENNNLSQEVIIEKKDAEKTEVIKPQKKKENKKKKEEKKND